MIEKACMKDAQDIYNLVQTSISETYPMYYKKQIVDFFSTYHNLDAITKDIENECVYILREQGQILVCGCAKKNEITRVYVTPCAQGKGWGSKMMQFLEEKIAKSYDYATVDVSLSGTFFYELRGYKTISHGQVSLTDGVMLVYEIAQKQLR